MNLNKKWWHRLIKVIFIISILISVLSSTLIIIDYYSKPNWEMFGYILIALLSSFVFFSLLRYLYFYIIKNEHKYLFNEKKEK